MKIITDKAAYLQKYYLNILTVSSLATGVGIPISMLEVIGKKKFKKYDKKDFIKFTKKEEIDYLKNADWIIDYNDYINKDIKEIQTEIEEIDANIKQSSEEYKSLSKREQIFQYGEFIAKIKMIRYKKESLTDIIKIKENSQEATFTMPTKRRKRR